MQTVQLKVEADYHDKLLGYCQRFGVTKAELVRFMLDTLDNWGVTDDEFERWFEDRKHS